MADIRITDIVAEEAFQQLEKLSSNLNTFKEDYTALAKELTKSIKLKVEVTGDLDKLNTIVAQKTQEAAKQTERLNEVVSKQREIVSQTTNTISRELAVIEKENAAKRAAFDEDNKALKVAQEILGTRQQNIERLARINDELRDVTASQKELNKQQDAGRISQQDYVARMSNLIDRERELKAAKQDLAKTLSNEEKMNQAAAGSYTQLSLKLELMKKAYKQLNEQEKASASGKVLGAEIQNLDARLKDLAADMGEFQRNVGNYAVAAESPKKALKELIVEIATLTLQYRQMSDAEKKSAAGQELSNKLKAMTQQASDYRDAIDDVNRDIKEGANDTAKFSALSEAIDMVVSNLGAATGAARALGLTDEDLLEVQTKIQASLAVSNALVRTQTALQKESALMKSVSAIQTSALATAENIATAAKGKGIIATKAATVAQAAFNAVANMNPYVLLATAILTVVGGIYLLIKANKEEAKSEEEAKKAAEERAKVHEDFRKTVADSAGAQVAAYMKMKKAWDALGNSLDKKKRFVKENQGEFKKLGISVNNVSQAENVLVKNTNAVVQAIILRAQAAAYEKAITDEYTKLINEKLRIEQETSKQLQGAKRGDEITKAEAGKVDKKNLKTTTDLFGGTHYYVMNDQGVKQVNDARNLAQWTSRQNQLTEATNKSSKAIDILSKGMENVQKQQAEIFFQNGFTPASEDGVSGSGGGSGSGKDKAKSAQEISEMLMKISKDRISAELELETEGSQQWAEVRKDYIKATSESEIAEAKKTQESTLAEMQKSLEQGNITKDQYDKAKVLLEEDTQGKILAIQRKAESDEREIDEKVHDFKTQLAEKQIEQQEKLAAAQSALDDAEYSKRVNALKAQYVKDLELCKGNAKKKAEVEKKYQLDMLKLSQSYEVKKAQDTIDTLKTIIDTVDMTDEQRADIEAKLAEAQMNLNDQVADNAIENAERMAEADAEYAEKVKQQHEMIKENLKNILNGVFDFISTIYDGQMQKVEEQQDANDEAGEAEQERIEKLVESKVITEEEGEARKRAAEKKTSEQNEKLEKKKAELQRKQAIFQKAQSIANITINTAEAIVKALRDLGPILGPPAAAVVGALGAVQLATVIATPLPKYAKGTDSHMGGLAIVGDGGKAELISFDGKSYLTPDSPTLVNMPKGAKVYPDANAIVDDLAHLNMVGSGDDSAPVTVVNDYKELEKRIDVTNELLKKSIIASRRNANDAIYQQFITSKL